MVESNTPVNPNNADPLFNSDAFKRAETNQADVEDRILAIVPDNDTFTMKDLQASLPDLDYWRINRAIINLRKVGHIAYVKTISRVKHFAKTSELSLPIIKANGRSFPITALILEINEKYDRHFRTAGAKEISRIPTTVARLFRLAFKPDDSITPKDRMTEWQYYRAELIKSREAAVRAQEICDAILMHSSMRGNMAEFVATWTGSQDSPIHSDVNVANLWATNEFDKNEV